MIFMPWTNEMTATLVKLADGTRSSTTLQHLINDQYKTQVTRNAVIGKVHRMGLPMPRPPRAVKDPPKARPNRTAPFAIRSSGPPKPLPAGRTPSLDLARPSGNPDGCQWPAAEDMSAVCGRRIVKGSYCETHAAKVYAPVPARRR